MMLDSLLDQDIPSEAYEIIVVDDGSTQDISNLKHYAETYPCIHYYHKENGGQSSARNMGLNLAKGKWVYFCDSDDYFHPQVFGDLLKTAEGLELDVLVFDAIRVKAGSSPLKQDKPFDVSGVYTGIDYLAMFTHYPMGFDFGVWRLFIKKSLLLDHGIWFKDLGYIEDRLFQMDLLPVVERIAYVKAALYYYVQRESSILHSQKRKNYEKYAPWLWQYIERLTDSMQSGPYTSSPGALTVIKEWRDYAIFSILINSLRYSSVSTTKRYLKELAGIENAFPINNRGNKAVKFVCKCMEHPRLWMALCRIYHLVPRKVRQAF